MKISIKVFGTGEIALDIERAEDGTPVATKAFFSFSDRPRHPHLSFFSEPKPGRSYLEPHFTADAREPGRKFRASLARVEAGALRSGLTSFMTQTMCRFFGGLQQADLDVLTNEGWLVHYVDERALRRWVRRGPPWVLDGRVIGSFVRHLLRRAAPPISLKALDLLDCTQAALLRIDGAHRFRVRFLTYIPIDIPLAQLLSEEAVPTLVPRGWYVVDVPDDEPAWEKWGFDDMLPKQELEKIGDKIGDLLRGYPTRGAPPDLDAQLEGFPLVLSAVLGFYSHDLLNWIMMVKEERERARVAARGPNGEAAVATKSSPWTEA
jgi:hypothetical protein